MKENDLYEDKELDIESLILRRSDADDRDHIIGLMDEGHAGSFLNVYENNDILHKIETSCLSISVLNPQGNIIAFASFDDHPQVRHFPPSCILISLFTVTNKREKI
jgi:hypothetical protein